MYVHIQKVDWWECRSHTIQFFERCVELPFHPIGSACTVGSTDCDFDFDFDFDFESTRLTDVTLPYPATLPTRSDERRRARIAIFKYHVVERHAGPL